MRLDTNSFYIDVFLIESHCCLLSLSCSSICDGDGFSVDDLEGGCMRGGVSDLPLECLAGSGDSLAAMGVLWGPGVKRYGSCMALGDGVLGEV